MFGEAHSRIIVGYIGTKEYVAIPNDKSIIKIENWAFAENKVIVEIIIPAGVTQIGHGAFLNCINLQSIEIPFSMKQIGYMAFYNCDKLGVVYYRGTNLATWRAMDIDNEGGTNRALIAARRYHYSNINNGFISFTSVEGYQFYFNELIMRWFYYCEEYDYRFPLNE